METRKNFIDRNLTNIIKGIALIFMFVHHFFGFPRWYIDGISYPQLKIFTRFFVSSLKICVPIFAFLTGYFYFYNDNKTYKYSFKKITDVWVTYIVFYLLIVATAVILKVYVFSAKRFILELFALHNKDMIFCWYVIFYALTMLILPIYSKLSEKSDVLAFFLAATLPLLINLFVNGFFNNSIGEFDVIISNLPWFPCIASGFIFAKYGLFYQIQNFLNSYNKKLRVLLCVFLIMTTLLTRYITTSYDFIYAPFFIYGVVESYNCIKHRIFFIPISIIGNYSMQMWFIHCIFFNCCKIYTQPVLYFLHNPILVTVWGLFMCVLVAIAFNKPVKVLIKVKNKLFE